MAMVPVELLDTGTEMERVSYGCSDISSRESKVSASGGEEMRRMSERIRGALRGFDATSSTRKVSAGQSRFTNYYPGRRLLTIYSRGDLGRIRKQSQRLLALAIPRGESLLLYFRPSIFGIADTRRG